MRSDCNKQRSRVSDERLYPSSSRGVTRPCPSNLGKNNNKRKRYVNETQFVELSNEDHGTTSIKHQRLIEKDILENVEWLESISFCLGEMIQNNYVNDRKS